jgi:hypothetical protein
MIFYVLSENLMVDGKGGLRRSDFPSADEVLKLSRLFAKLALVKYT